jgi:hypothetical protein
MSDEVLVKVEGVSKKFCRSLKNCSRRTPKSAVRIAPRLQLLFMQFF